MPLLSWADPLPWTPSRVLVAGTSGAGKTRLATLVAQRWQLPRVELDALHHGEGWVPRPTFAREVELFAVIRWAWRTQGGPGQRVAALLAQRGAHVAVVRLRGRRQVHQWVGRSLARPLILDPVDAGGAGAPAGDRCI